MVFLKVLWFLQRGWLIILWMYSKSQVSMNQNLQKVQVIRFILQNMKETLYFYVSPFWRACSTFENIVRSFPRSQFEYSEEPRLREQEWGYLRTYAELKQLKKERKEYGIFYYRFPGGEAGTDVYDRINDLLGSLHRDFQRENYPRNCILVTHSLAIRLFIMRWFHLTVEEFDQMLSPKNGQLVVLQLNEETDDYELLTPLERDENAVLRSRPIRLPCT